MNYSTDPVLVAEPPPQPPWWAHPVTVLVVATLGSLAIWLTS